MTSVAAVSSAVPSATTFERSRLQLVEGRLLRAHRRAGRLVDRLEPLDLLARQRQLALEPLVLPPLEALRRRRRRQARAVTTSVAATILDNWVLMPLELRPSRRARLPPRPRHSRGGGEPLELANDGFHEVVGCRGARGQADGQGPAAGQPVAGDDLGLGGDVAVADGVGGDAGRRGRRCGRSAPGRRRCGPGCRCCCCCSRR